MKKKWIGLAVLLLILSIGAVAFAQNADGTWSFNDRLPFMKKMHPDMSDQELEQMFNNCQEENGMRNGMHRGMHNRMMHDSNFEPMMRGYWSQK